MGVMTGERRLANVEMRDFVNTLLLASALALVLESSQGATGAADPPTYYLGFLSPSPDAAIPASLAVEWQSAFQVAVEVLNSEMETFKLEALSQNCTCDFQSAQDAVNQLLQKKGLIGVVGPACTEAAMSAAKTLQEHGVPLVSFAATASRLSDRHVYPNFFRTVYSDDHQASAIAATITKLQMTNITIVYTNDGYSSALAQKIRALCGDNVFKMQLLELGVNATINTREFEGMFKSIEPYSFLVLAVQPAIAEKLWKLVVDLGKSTYPWWYLGTDGITAADPNIQGKALEGEVGLAPYGGDTSSDLVCQRFYKHWNEKSYPGLSNKSSSYVPYLIDTVMSFFEVVKGLQAAGSEVNSFNVLTTFASINVTYRGCTGAVQLDPQTGSRLVSSEQSAIYDFVSYLENSWELKGRIVNDNFSSLQPLQRPGTFPADGQIYMQPASISSSQEQHHSKPNKALIAGIVVFSGAFVLVSVSFICYHKIRQQSPLAFLRMPAR